MTFSGVREYRHTEGGILGTNSNHEHVERDHGVGSVALDLRFVADVDKTLLVVDLRGRRFVVFHVGLLVTEDVADGLHDRAVLDQTGRARGQQGREKEEVTGRDDDDIVVLRVEFFEQGDRAPSGSWNRDRVSLDMKKHITERL